jgi:nucleoside-diphosphate-sugar epimerase
MKTVLIVGGTGFIGKNVADYFNSKGYIVSILSRKIFPNYPFRMYEWDSLNQKEKKSFMTAELTVHDFLLIP